MSHPNSSLEAPIDTNLLILPNSNSNSTVPSTCSSITSNSNSSSSSPLQIPSLITSDDQKINLNKPSNPSQDLIDSHHSLLTNNLTINNHDNHNSPDVADWLEGTSSNLHHNNRNNTITNSNPINPQSTPTSISPIHSSPPSDLSDPINQLSLNSSSLTPRQASMKLTTDLPTPKESNHNQQFIIAPIVNSPTTASQIVTTPRNATS
ncbi:hypothetical protein DFH28DRAFT_308915 [Melampsora americana]|nr:hypothetical protein DFH28DRAFT_308915 [Melampsora americana]